MDNKNLSIENYRKLREEQSNRNPLMYGASVDVGVKPTSNPLTYNIETPNVEVKGLSEGAKKELQYIGKSAEVGFKKGVDLMVAVDKAIQNLENPMTVETTTKQWAMDAIEEKDAFYLSNKDDINGATQFIGGMVEQIANPVELGINAIETFATGGSNIWVKLGKTALYNGATTVGLENIYSKRYKDEYLSMEENITVGLQSAILSSVMTGIGEVKGRMLSEKNIAGDTNINVRTEMDNYNDVYSYKGDNAQKMYTNYTEQVATDVDPYVAKLDIVESDKYKGHPLLEGYEPKLKVEVKGTYTDPNSVFIKEINSIASEVEDFTHQSNLANIMNEGIEVLRKGRGSVESTVLSRRFDEIKVLDNLNTYINDNDLGEYVAIGLEKQGIKVPKNFSKKDIVQQNTVLQNKTNNIVEELLNDVKSTVDYTYENVKQAWKKDDTAKPTIVSYNQIDMSLNKIDAKYQTQKLYVQNEYMNKINGKNGTMTVEDYIKSLGKDEKTIAKEWVNGMKNTVEGDKNDFLKTAYKDSIMLDELNMKTSLYDIDDFKEFQANYGKHFDENGNILFSDDLMETISKLDRNSQDYHTLVNAMKDNTHEWVEFVVTAKDKLEGQYTAKQVKDTVAKRKSLQGKLDKIDREMKREINKINKDLVALKKEIKELEKAGGINSKDYYDMNTEKLRLQEEMASVANFYGQIKAVEEETIMPQIKELDEFLAIHKGVEAYDKALSKKLMKNKDFIDKEYMNIITGIDVKNKEPKVWKKEVAMKLAQHKKELAEESIKLNQVINKKNLLGGAQEYFTESVYTNNLDNVTLRADKVSDFIEQVIPFYKNGVIKLPEGLSTDMNLTSQKNIKIIADNFKELVADIKLTRQSTKSVGEYKTLGELRKYFNEGEMPNFFLNYRDGAYVKNNADIIRDIFDKNTSQTARYIAYGSTSPFTMRNRLQQIGTTAKKLNPNLSDTEKGIISNFVGQRGINMLNHTQGLISKPQDLTSKVNGIAQKVIATKYLVGTGLEELTGQNVAIALYRGQKFGGASVYVNTAQFQAMKMAKNSSKIDSGDLGKYTLGNLRNSVDMKKATDGAWDKYMEIGLMAQKMSDNQLKKISDVVSTATLDKLPTDYSKLTKEMQSLLRVNGIDEMNYLDFAKFTKDHIADNNYYVNMNSLVDMINDGKYNKNADALRNVYYALTDYIGDVKSHTKFNDVKYDAFTSWGNMFRSFSRAMNRDTLTRFMYATNSEGVGVNRFSLNYVKNNFGDLVSDTSSGLIVGTMALGIGGMSRDVSKEIIRSGRTLLQRMGVIETKIDTVLESGIIENIANLMYSGSIEEIVNELSGNGSSILGSERKQLEKIYSTFTNEEKKAFGTNYEDGLKSLGLYLISFAGKPIVNNVQGLMKDDIYDLEKVHGFTKEQQEKYESHVRKYINNSEQFVKDIKENITVSKKQVQAEIDYMDGSNNSFDLLSDEHKTIVETIINNSNVEDKDDFRQEATLLITQGGTKEELVESLANSRPMDDIKIDETIKELNQIEDVKEVNHKNVYSTFSAKRKKLFNDIMKVQGKKEITDEDYKMFVNIFEGKDKVTLKDILNTYNIKQTQLIRAQ